MKVTTPSDRVQLIDRGSLMHPGCCALCGSGNCDEGYVDTGIYYDYEGQVYFCWNCAMQIAAVIGCLSSDEHGIMRALLENTAAKLKATEEELGRATERLNDYDSLMLRALTIGDDGPAAVSGDPVTSQSTNESDESVVSNASIDSTDVGEPVVKKPVASGGRRKPARTQRSDSNPEGFTI